MNRQLHNGHGHEGPPSSELAKRAMARHHNISTAESGLASLTEDTGNVLDPRELLAKRGLFPQCLRGSSIAAPRLKSRREAAVLQAAGAVVLRLAVSLGLRNRQEHRPHENR